MSSTLSRLGISPQSLAAALGLALAAVFVYELAGALLALALRSVGHALLQMALLTLPGWFCLVAFVQPRAPRTGGTKLPLGLRIRGTKLQLGRPWEADAVAVMSLPLTCLLVGATLVPLQMLGAPNYIFSIVVLAGYGGLAATIGLSRPWRARLVEFVRAYRHFFGLHLLASLCAVFYLSVGLIDPGQISDWQYAAHRNYKLQIDNHLSWLTSETWRRHLEPNALFFSTWRIGDRGPLYSVLHSFFYRALQPTEARYAEYIRLGILLNALFTGPLFLWLRRLTGTPRAAWGCAAIVVLNPWFFINLYYTWPKLFGAGLLLGALFLLWRDEPPDAFRYAAAGVMFGLGSLAHAGNLLSFPVFYIVTLALYARSPRGFARSLLMPACLVLTFLPWEVYKRLYSPESFNLIVLHYLDNTGYGRPIAENIRDFFQRHPAGEQIRVRTEIFGLLWWKTLEWELLRDFWSGKWNPSRLFTAEFFHPWYSAGMLWFPWIVVGLMVNACSWLLRSAATVRLKADATTVTPPRSQADLAGAVTIVGSAFRRTSPTPRWTQYVAPFVADRPFGGGRPIAAALVFAFVSLSVNAVARWANPHTHELPYFETLLLAVVGAYLLRRLGRFYWAVALIAVLARQIGYFVESARTHTPPLPAIDGHGVLFLASLALIAMLSFTIDDNPPSSAPSRATRTEP